MGAVSDEFHDDDNKSSATNDDSRSTSPHWTNTDNGNEWNYYCSFEMFGSANNFNSRRKKEPILSGNFLMLNDPAEVAGSNPPKIRLVNEIKETPVFYQR